MDHIHRALKDAITQRITGDNRHVLLFGARQTGKTTLSREIMEQLAPGTYLLLSGEDPRTAEQISSCDLDRLRGLLSGYRYVLLDEARPNQCSPTSTAATSTPGERGTFWSS